MEGKKEPPTLEKSKKTLGPPQAEKKKHLGMSGNSKRTPRWTRGAKKEPSAGCFFIEFILKNVKNRGAKLTEAPAEFFSI